MKIKTEIDVFPDLVFCNDEGNGYQCGTWLMVDAVISLKS